MAKYLSLGICAVLLVSSLSACGIEPWVKPYERANLADPIMIFDRDPVASGYVGHIHDIREGARGGSGAGGGGCGCN